MMRRRGPRRLALRREPLAGVLAPRPRIARMRTADSIDCAARQDPRPKRPDASRFAGNAQTLSGTGNPASRNANEAHAVSSRSGGSRACCADAASGSAKPRELHLFAKERRGARSHVVGSGIVELRQRIHHERRAERRTLEHGRGEAAIRAEHRRELAVRTLLPSEKDDGALDCAVAGRAQVSPT